MCIARKWRHIATRDVRHMCGHLVYLALFYFFDGNSYTTSSSASAGRALGMSSGTGERSIGILPLLRAATIELALQ